MVAQQQRPMGIGFDAATRLKRILLPGQAKSTSGQVISWQLPRVGFLRAVFLPIRLTITDATGGGENALGQACIVENVSLSVNSGLKLIDMSGVHYHYLMRHLLEMGQDVVPQSTGRSAVAAGASKLDMYLPLAPNQRDPVGLVNLQTEENTYTLTLTFAANATVATNVSAITGTITPLLEIFTVPDNEADYPPDDVVQRILGDTRAVAQTSEYEYAISRGDILLQIAHGYGIGVAGADSFSTARLRVNQSENLIEWQPQHMDMFTPVESAAGSQRLIGTWTYDLVSSSGLGNYDKYRDAVDSARLTDFSSLFTPSSQPVTLYTLRRSLTRIG